MSGGFSAIVCLHILQAPDQTGHMMLSHPLGKVYVPLHYRRQRIVCHLHEI